jgi:hypothetical protein
VGGGRKRFVTCFLVSAHERDQKDDGGDDIVMQILCLVRQMVAPVREEEVECLFARALRVMMTSFATR